jgi:hypothetical protein
MNQDDEFTRAIDFLRHDRRFQSVLTRVVTWREDSISRLGTYKDDSELRKSAAEVTVYTEFLDMFGVPSGEVQTPGAEP